LDDVLAFVPVKAFGAAPVALFFGHILPFFSFPAVGFFFQRNIGRANEKRNLLKTIPCSPFYTNEKCFQKN
jgi:hypothetical protein